MNRVLRYAWASPNTALGLALGILALLFGARWQARQGALEFAGGALGALVAARWLACPFRALTLGHVILAIDAGALDGARRHEQVHVRQYEQWGPLFLPAYLASSLWQFVCGRRCYRDNWFERQAFDRS